MHGLRRLTITVALVLGAIAVSAMFGNFRARALNSTSAATSDPVTRSLTGQLQSDSSSTRASAALALSGASDRDAVTALLGSLGDSDPTAGYYTALALTGNADPIAFDSLVAELESSQPLVRQRAALALSRSGIELPAAAIPALSAALDDGTTSQAAAL